MKITFKSQLLLEDKEVFQPIFKDVKESTSKTVRIFEHILNKLNRSGVFIENTDLKRNYPSLEFPDNLEIEVDYVQDKDIFNYFSAPTGSAGSIPDGLPSLVGVCPITNGEGFLGNTEYTTKFRILAYADDETLEDLIKEALPNGLDDDHPHVLSAVLSSYFNTLTHEIIHALEFIENAGGMTPHDVDNCCDSGDFDYTVSECSTGFNTPAYGEAYGDLDYQDDVDRDEIVDIMETRVENRGMELLNNLRLDLIELYLNQESVPEAKKMLKMKC